MTMGPVSKRSTSYICTASEVSIGEPVSCHCHVVLGAGRQIVGESAAPAVRSKTVVVPSATTLSAHAPRTTVRNTRFTVDDLDEESDETSRRHGHSKTVSA